MDTVHKETQKRLVLGFDAGCALCSNLAQRIEERVGEKLEVRSLYDPQMNHWREEVLGEDAPWAPTLVEVDGTKVRAWIGLRMGARLSRTLGPMTTWRIIQELGETGSVLDSEPASGMSRARFLKGGLGGAAVAFSALFGLTAFPRTATASQQRPASIGTPAQQAKAEKIIRASGEFRALDKRTGVAFDFEEAELAFEDELGLGAVSVPAVSGTNIGIVAIFLLSLEKEEIVSSRYIESDRNREGVRRISFYENGKRVGRVLAKTNHAILPDGRKVSYGELRKEGRQLKQANNEAVFSAQAKSRCKTCKDNVEFYCNLVATTGCGVLGPVGIPCDYLVDYANYRDSGCVAAGVNWCTFQGPRTPCA